MTSKQKTDSPTEGLSPKAPKPESAGVQTLDFTNPDQLAQALTASNLTDQEEEELLKQALIINRKLKEELQLRHDRERQKSGRNRLGSARKPTLPPIEKLDKQKKIYGKATSKSLDEKSRGPSKPPKRSTSPKSHSSTGPRKPPSASSPRKSGGSAPPGVTRSKTTMQQKPEWDGRFSYD